MRWIKIVTDIFDDEKILLIEAMPDHDALIVIWFKLLCLAGKQNNCGVFLLNDKIPYTDEMLATIFRRPIATVRLALRTFEELGMVEVINNTITIPNWGKHQSIDQIEKRREFMRGYMKEYRQKQKQKALSDGGETCKPNDKPNVRRADKIRVEENRGDTTTPYPSTGGDGGERPDFNTVEVYAANNLQSLSPGNMAELVSFKDDLPDEMIRLAIDEACSHGARNWSYVKHILNRWLDAGIKTVGEAKAESEKREAAKKPSGEKPKYNWG